MGRRAKGSQGRRPQRLRSITTTVCQCKDCGLIFTDPQPIPIDIQDHYGVPPEDYWRPEYFEIDPSYFQHEIDRLGQLMRIDGLRTLDIGAGLGKQMIALKAAGFESHGLEPSKPFHEKAVQRMGIDPQRLKLGMLEDIDYPKEYFGFISFGAVLEHLYDPSACIKRALQWLKPDGLIHIEVPSSTWLVHKLINAYYSVMAPGFVANLSPMHRPYHLFEFDLKSFEKNGRMHGYKIAFHERYICETYMPRLFDPLLKGIMARTGTGMQLCVWLRKL